ncbi:YodC family protein [Paraburkholderia sp. DHOC27]|uniref:YodC family protein n=1 Tax=Paraburkholderia sp. DHOC27 TaxID=2303330 RepID=UPI000E3C6D69|nr:YodC family protein [Paraburkholderia sp. DHOC27]RFU44661.1 DUF2158 domain-containing protein [Paraburkholderia sp. DHOC27]
MLTATLDAFDTPSMTSFNVGDVVTLKSGGLRMTVTAVGPVALSADGWVMCEWFDEHGELRQESFEQTQVRLEPRSIPAGSVKLRHVRGFAQSA